jgi:hypothetical protein
LLLAELTNSTTRARTASLETRASADPAEDAQDTSAAAARVTSHGLQTRAMAGSFHWPC